MYPKPLQRLIELFSELPGVGPRQATRMAFFVFREPKEYGTSLVEAIRSVKRDIISCSQCYRSMEKNQNGLCEFCRNPGRNQREICVIEKELDASNIEKTGVFGGVYHVLGGVFSPLDPDAPRRLRLKELYQRAESLLPQGNVEIIIGTSPTTEGDTTALYIERILEPLEKVGLLISKLGRGVSVGAEVEYIDEVTLKSAFKNRKR